MAETKKSLLEHPFYSRVLGTLTVTAILGLLYRYGTAIWLVTNYSVPIPLWFLVLLILAIVVLGVLLAAALSVARVQQHQKQQKPDPYRDFRRGTFYGIIWRWSYSIEQIKNITPFCPNDLTPLKENAMQEWHSTKTLFHCVACDKVYGPIQKHPVTMKEDITRIIYGLIDSGKWKEFVEQDPNRKAGDT